MPLPGPVPAEILTFPAPPGEDDLPLRGVTVLLVEDSRLASEAIRLVCRRAGARLRRADSLAAARSHLAVYRPDAAIVDMGLPDGRGEVLIRDLARRSPRVPVLLGMSGDPGLRQVALAAGAEDFLEKPVTRIAALPERLADRLRGGGAPPLPPAPDRQALLDDLLRAEAALAGLALTGGRPSGWLAGFLSGVARLAGDAELEGAARRCRDGPGLDRLRALVALRIAQAPAAFAPPPAAARLTAPADPGQTPPPPGLAPPPRFD